MHTLDAENEDLQAQLFALRRQQQDRFQRPDRGFQGVGHQSVTISQFAATSTRPDGSPVDEGRLEHAAERAVVQVGC